MNKAIREKVKFFQSHIGHQTFDETSFPRTNTLKGMIGHIAIIQYDFEDDEITESYDLNHDPKKSPLRIKKKPLSMITDKDLKVCEFNFPKGRDFVRLEFEGTEWKAYESKSGFFISEGHLLPHHVEYLFDKGYAVPFREFTADDQLKRGWIHLNNH